METAQLTSWLNRRVSRSKHFWPVIALPYFLVDSPDHWDSRSILVRPFLLMIVVLAAVMWFHSTRGRLTDLSVSLLWVLPISIPLVFYVLAIYQHWLPLHFYLTVAFVFGAQLPFLILPSRKDLVATLIGDSTGLQS
jgi:hypothetical protein